MRKELQKDPFVTAATSALKGLLECFDIWQN